MKYKYMCHSGYVRSYDGDKHYIPANHLPIIYGVPKEECKFINNLDQLRGYSENDLNKLIHLFPRSSGNYDTLPPMGTVENN